MNQIQDTWLILLFKFETIIFKINILDLYFDKSFRYLTYPMFFSMIQV